LPVAEVLPALPEFEVPATRPRRGLDIRLLDLRTSAATAGEPDRVVGYGAFVVS
jgi:AmmeMemoRadiSam system protein B